MDGSETLPSLAAETAALLSVNVIGRSARLCFKWADEPSPTFSAYALSGFRRADRIYILDISRRPWQCQR